MSFTRTYPTSDAYLSGTDYMATVDNKVNTLAADYRERLAVDHDFRSDEAGSEATQAPTGTIGYHKKVTLTARSTSPATVSGAGIVFTKSVDSVVELFYRDGSGSEIQLTSGGYSAGVPSGTICMWHGTIANIPSGWYLCDGNNGTPNLVAKFVRGVATAATDPGTTGGSDTHTHTLTAATVDAHTHTGTTEYTSNFRTLEGAITEYPNQWDVNPDIDHKHTFTTDSSGGSTSISGTTDSGSTLPAYYEIAYIMKA